MNTDDQHASPQAQELWGKLTLRERRQRRAERNRNAIYERAKVSVPREGTESIKGAIPPGRPGVERHVSAGDHVIFARRNRALVAGQTTRVGPAVGRPGWAFLAALFGGAVIWIVGGLVSLLIALAGAFFAAAAAVFEFQRNALFDEHGLLLTGEVTRVEESSGWVFAGYPPGAMAPIYRLGISYRFLTPSGEERSGDLVLGNAGHPVPSPGDHLAILYADGIRERVM